jgi:uncharacterized protein YjdB
MKTKTKDDNFTRDLIIKIVLIVIIILLLIHNCVLQKENNKYQNNPAPNGNVDIIDIKCNDGNKCKPTPTIAPTTKPNDNSETKPKEDKKEEIQSLSFASGNVSVRKGHLIQLIVTVKPTSLSKELLTWTSSDTSIVLVDEKGLAIGLKEGTAEISVTSDNGKTATCIVTVTTDKVDVDKIILNPTTMTLKVGETGQIEATIKPDNATERSLVWESSDTSIATVNSNGIVEGIKPGTVTITVKTPDGKVIATTTVTIKPIEVEEIILEPNDVTIKVGDTEQITATIKPNNATDKELIWESSDPTVATVDSTGKITAKKIGNATITAKTKDGKVVATVQVTVDNDDDDDSFKVYDEEKTPVNWNGATDLKIFSKSIYNIDGVIAPESENTYEFIVKNSTQYTIKYDIEFNETNNYNINMKYKLKKNGTYIIDHYVSASELIVTDQELSTDGKDTYYLEWKWISSSNDNSIGTNPEANYGLEIEVKAESVN